MALTIVTQPQSQFVDLNDIASFSVSATGDGAITYQWYEYPNTIVSGANLEEYSVTGTSATHLNEYYCEISDTGNTVNTDIVTLYVYESVPILSDSVGFGSSITTETELSDSVAFGDEPDTELIFNDTSAFGNVPVQETELSDSVSVGAEPTEELEFHDSVSFGDEPVEIIEFHDSVSFGDEPTEEIEFHDSVSFGTTATDVMEFTDSIIINDLYISDPFDVSATEGDNVSFVVTATGGATGVYVYSWYKDGMLIGGTHTNTYSIYSVGESDEGMYACSVMDSGVSALSDNAQLIVTTSGGPIPELTIVEHPQSISVHEGDIAEFNVVVSGGCMPYNYRWVVNGSDAPYDSDIIKFVASVDQDGMHIFVEVTDDCGSIVVSDIATLYVGAKPDDCCLKTYYMGGPYNLLCHMFGNGKNILEDDCGE